MSPFMGGGVMGDADRKGTRAAHGRMQGARASAGMFVISGQDMNRVASKDKEKM